MTVTTPEDYISVQIRGGRYHNRFFHLRLDELEDGAPPQVYSVTVMDPNPKWSDPAGPHTAGRVTHLYHLETWQRAGRPYYVYVEDGETLVEPPAAAA